MSTSIDIPGKSWIDWLRGLALGFFACLALLIGIAEVHGVTDARGVVRHDAAAPCLITAPLLAALSAMFVVQAVARSRPLIQVRKEGIICREVGARNDLGLPSKVALLVNLLTGKGFKQSLYYFEWESLAMVRISGIRMSYMLTIYGPGTDMHGNHITSLSLQQHEFGSPILEAAEWLNGLLRDPKLRECLPTWEMPTTTR